MIINTYAFISRPGFEIQGVCVVEPDYPYQPVLPAQRVLARPVIRSLHVFIVTAFVHLLTWKTSGLIVHLKVAGPLLSLSELQCVQQTKKRAVSHDYPRSCPIYATADSHPDALSIGSYNVGSKRLRPLLRGGCNKASGAVQRKAQGYGHVFLRLLKHRTYF